MDVVICEPELSYRGGGQEVIRKIAERFNPIIYTTHYDPSKMLPELKEFDIRPIWVHIPKFSSQFLNNVRSGAFWLSCPCFKIPGSYDVLNAHGPPSQWLRYRNERVCWCCNSPYRGAYDLCGYTQRNTPVYYKAPRLAFVRLAKVLDGGAVPKIEKICANSGTVKKRIGKYLHRDDAEIINPGVDIKDYTCKDFQKFFFYPSRFIPEKRMEYAISAFRKAGLPKSWKLVIAGFVQNDVENNYLNHLRSISNEDVEFVTNASKTQLFDLYSTCYAGLFCAINEDWGLTPIEAMASSKPVISVNEGGPTESVIDGKTGFLVNSPDEMAQKMHFLANHPGICERMGKAGRRRVEQNYTWKIFLDKMEKAFKETAKM